MDYNINCGGYALGINTCIFGDGKYTFDEAVWGLLRNFKFIRLINESDKINDNEYKVYYRNDGWGGHHFVREDNGIKTDKWGPEEIKQFDGWLSLETAKEAIFAVNKEHEDYKHSIFIADIIPENFERTIRKIINNHDKIQTFIFNKKEYEMKNIDDDIFSVTEKESGEKVADVLKYMNKRTIFPETNTEMIMEIEKNKKEGLISDDEKKFNKWLNEKNREKSLDEIINGYKSNNENIKENNERNVVSDCYAH